MSRLVNYKTVRFSIFDSWYGSWFEQEYYQHALFEDLNLRSYFSGLFYRLRIPTNYLYIKRFNTKDIIFFTDFYFFRFLKKNKLKFFFIEQIKYYHYFLKKYYLYSRYFLFRNIIITSDTFWSSNQLPISLFENFEVLHNYLEYSNRRYSNIISFYLSSTLSTYQYIRPMLRKHRDILEVDRYIDMNALFEFFYNTFVYCRFFFVRNYNGLRPKVTTLKQWIKVKRVARRSYSDVSLHLTTFLVNRKRILKWFLRYLWVSKKKVTTLNNYNLILVSRLFMQLLSLSAIFIQNVDLSFIKQYINILGLNSITTRLMVKRTTSLHSYMLSVAEVQYFKSISSLSINILTSSLINISTSNYLVFLLFKQYYFFNKVTKFKAVSSNYYYLYSLMVGYIWPLLYFFRSFNTINFMNSILTILRSFNMYRKCYNLIFHIETDIVYTWYNHFIQTRRSLILYNNQIFSFLRNTKLNRYHELTQLRAVKKYTLSNFVRSNRKWLFKKFYNTIFSSFIYKIEQSINTYVKTNAWLLINVHYKEQSLQYPPITNAKIVADYIFLRCYQGKKIPRIFYELKLWQLSNYEQRRVHEYNAFLSQLSGVSFELLDHLSYKWYPVIGIRIECSGTTKKGRRKRKVFYGDYIHNTVLLTKSPNNTLCADLDYYQSFVILKSASIGIKVWIFFKTHLYNANNKFISMLAYT